MVIEKVSSLTGTVNSMDLDITEEQLISYINGDDLIQRIFPNLSSEQREFLKSGITPDEWKTYFGEM